MSSEKLCPCGQPLHYHDPQVRELVEREIQDLGECITMRFLVGGLRTRAFLVPRHYIALHGANLDDVVKMKFEEIR